MNIAIIGATGLVGKEILKVLDSINISVTNIIPLASEKSKGEIVSFRDKEYIIDDLKNWKEYKIDYALFSAGGDISRQYIPLMIKENIVVIDNSSVFRMVKDIPLVVPCVNFTEETKKEKLIANPNCSTIQMVVVLNELKKLANIKRVVVSTYQSTSGAGIKGIDELTHNTKERLNNTNNFSTKVFKHNIDANCIPHIDVFENNDYTKEEMKMINETSKILNTEIPLTATCVRVPTFIGHCESLNIEFDKSINIEEIKSILSQNTEIVVQDNPELNEYPLNSYVEGCNKTFVGRIRKDYSLDNAINLWIVADNLRVGAAYNAVNILKYLVN